MGNDSNGGEKVYDMTKYLDEHPGGAEIVLEYAGRSADDTFENVGHSKEARIKMKSLQVGVLKVRQLYEESCAGFCIFHSKLS